MDMREYTTVRLHKAIRDLIVEDLKKHRDKLMPHLAYNIEKYVHYAVLELHKRLERN